MSASLRRLKPSQAGLGEAVVLETLAQGQLGQLPRGRVGQLVHDHHIVRHPPLGDLALHM